MTMTMAEQRHGENLVPDVELLTYPAQEPSYSDLLLNKMINAIIV